MPELPAHHHISRIFFLLCLSAIPNAHASAFSGWFGQCQNLGAQSVFIHQIQGPGDTSPLEGKDVQIQGVITTIAHELRGFYIQEETRDFDRNVKTSEGIFVYSQLLPQMEVGNIVKVRGEVQEHFGMTQLKAIGVSRPCGLEDVVSTALKLPLDNDFDWEYVEGMHVVLNEPSVILNTYNYTRYNELTIGNALLMQPTEIFAPDSPEAMAMREINARSKVTIDDMANGAPSMSQLMIPMDAQNTLRIGSMIDTVRGVVDFSFARYRIRTTHPLHVYRAPRPDMPEVKGDIKIASFNVLNLFNGDGQQGGFPTSRGADTLTEYQRQLDKIVTTLININADIVGLNELENDGYDETSSIAQLVDALNQRLGQKHYRFIKPESSQDPIGTDSISVGIIYRHDSVIPSDVLKVLTQDNSPYDTDGVLFNTYKNRPSFTQLFKEIHSNKEFVINVNHLKSKGSSCGEGDDDLLQANCNRTRTRATFGLQKWLNEQYPDTPTFILGDLNSYAKEDPIRVLEQAGFVNTVVHHSKKSYTYSFRGELGSLDYIFANTKAYQYVTDATVWHSNAAEPITLDYNDQFLRSDRKKPKQYYADDAYRASDHDVVLIGINLKETTPQR